MKVTNSVILPHILGNLSQKPEMCDTYDNLCNELEEVLSSENFTGNIRKEIQKALDVGEILGIITLTNEIIRIPFRFRTNAQNICYSGVMSNAVIDPNQSPHVPNKRTRSRSRGGRTRRRRSSSKRGIVRRRRSSSKRGSVRRRRSSSKRGSVRRRSRSQQP